MPHGWSLPGYIEVAELGKGHKAESSSLDTRPVASRSLSSTSPLNS